MAPLGDTGARLAVVGLGRSEAHATGFLLSNTEPSLQVDVLETPTGLTREELLARYDAVIYAVGDLGARALSVPGADLPGVTTATAFRAWLARGGQDQGADIDLRCRRAVVIGDSDAGLEVAKALALTPSPIEEIVVIGSAGPEQGGFTPDGLRNLDQLGDTDVVADPTETAVPASLREPDPDAAAQQNLGILQEYATRPRRGHPRRVALRFLLSPVGIIGHGRVQAIELARNTLVRDADGRLQPQPTGARATIPAGLVISAVAERPLAIRGLSVGALEDLNADEHGRVIGGDDRPTREYVSGGTRQASAAATVRVLLHDLATGRLTSAP